MKLHRLVGIKESEDQANLYFDIGHDDEDPHILWVYSNGKILAKESDGADDWIGSHGIIWGHDLCDKTFKGRYEPHTGRLSIAKPVKWKYAVPQFILDLLHQKFDYITKIVEC